MDSWLSCFLAFRSGPLAVLSPATRYFLSAFFPVVGAQAQARVPLKVSIKLVIPGVPADDTDKAFLIEDLDRMGCGCMLETLRCLKDVKMVRELKEGVPNQFKGTFRGCPEKWRTELWRGVDSFRANGNCLCGRIYKYVTKVFSGNPHKHDGFVVADCIDPRARAILAYLAPKLYAEKSLCITIRLSNTILEAFYGERVVD